MYVYICIYISIYIYICVCVYVYIHTCTYTYTYIYIYININIYKYIYIQIHTHTHTHTYLCVYLFISICLFICVLIFNAYNISFQAQASKVSAGQENTSGAWKLVKAHWTDLTNMTRANAAKSFKHTSSKPKKVNSWIFNLFNMSLARYSEKFTKFPGTWSWFARWCSAWFSRCRRSSLARRSCCSNFIATSIGSSCPQKPT